MWEAMLWGPYEGRDFQIAVDSNPYSEFTVNDTLKLELHEVAGITNPVLVCRSGNGSILSQTLLEPSRTSTNGITRTA